MTEPLCLATWKQGVFDFNTWSATETYQFVFYLGALLFAGLSFGSQYLIDHPCPGVFPFLLRMGHHALLYFIYFSVFAPTPLLPWALFLAGITFGTWILYRNQCVLTLLENWLCGYPKTRVFRDLTYSLSPKLDSAFRGIRIPLMLCMLVVLALRTYVSWRTNRIEVQGHRGARGNRPENTLAAFAYALDHGVTSLELDLHMSADGVLVIYHDETLDPQRCRPFETGTVLSSKPIRQLSLQEIHSYDCSSVANPAFPQQELAASPTPTPTPILTFTELLTFLRRSYPLFPVRLNVEIKTSPETDSDDYVQRFATKLVQVFETEGLVASSLIQSFDIRALRFVHALNPAIQTSYLFEPVASDGGNDTDSLESLVAVCLQHRVAYISPSFEWLTLQKVSSFHQHGIKVLPWTVNSLTDMERLLAWKVDGVITDYPVKMREYLAAH